MRTIIQCCPFRASRRVNMAARGLIVIVIIECLFFIPNNVEGTPGYFLSIRNNSVKAYDQNSIGNITNNFSNITTSVSHDVKAADRNKNRNFTYELSVDAKLSSHLNVTTKNKGIEVVDCFGLGSAVATALQWFLVGSCTDCHSAEVRFFLTSRIQPRRVQVLVGDQFGLEWTDFRHQRRTVIIVHGFLTESNEPWIQRMQEAFLLWGDVNVICVDWSAGGNSWNYYKAVVNTRTVARQITRLLGHIINATEQYHSVNDWGPLHLVGHSLGAHICGLVAHNYKALHSKWVLKRITGLDPAQPCFTTNDPTMKLDRTDAQYVDIIHTNGRLLSRLGLGLPKPVGHADFYPNGGMKQPGCFLMKPSHLDLFPLSLPNIAETICSHGRSHLYLTESLISAAHGNCTFWGHHWDLTYRSASKIQNRTCTPETCTEMGIQAENHPHRGTFYVITEEQSPFCAGNRTLTKEELRYLSEDLIDELYD